MPTKPIVVELKANPPRSIEISLAFIDRIETRMQRSLPEMLDAWRVLIPDRKQDAPAPTTDEEKAADAGERLGNAFGRYRMGEVTRFVAACLDVPVEKVTEALDGTSVFLAFWGLYTGCQRALARLLGVEIESEDREEPDAPKASPSSSGPGPG